MFDWFSTLIWRGIWIRDIVHWIQSPIRKPTFFKMRGLNKTLWKVQKVEIVDAWKSINATSELVCTSHLACSRCEWSKVRTLTNLHLIRHLGVWRCTHFFTWVSLQGILHSNCCILYKIDANWCEISNIFMKNDSNTLHLKIQFSDKNFYDE